jgi:hypothetical protein
MSILDDLRARHPRFRYRRYHIEHTDVGLRFAYEFQIEPDIVFRPSLTLPLPPAARLDAVPSAVLHNLAFHMGLAEIPSYWKATCAPEIIIEAGPLTPEQQAWWHNLLINGMTEFYYVNQIDFTAPDFVQVRAAPAALAPPLARSTHPLPAQRTLVPVGGGKDSVVTLDLLRERGAETGCLLLNPMQAARDIVQQSDCADELVVRRVIDPALLRLNAEGYLNGHTPFSSLISLLSVTCAVLFGYGRVAVSYERSSNEGNVRYLERDINHQYSKSFDFEQRFRAYAAAYLAPQVEFFSFVRPLYELQIARLFATMPRYHPVFRSCNRGLKSNSWCHNCPKCLFIYTALYPFLSEDEMGRIFSEDLFARADLLPLALQLLGHGAQKPFECVGAHEETLAAFFLGAHRLRAQGHPLPPLLQAIDEQVLQHEPKLEERAAQVLAAWNHAHALPAELAALLHERIAQMASRAVRR